MVLILIIFAFSFSGDSNLAHAKGILLFTGNSGLWLVHSIPNFPNSLPHGYSYPKSGLLYGQVLLCISFNVDESANHIIEHLLTIRPKIYSHQISKALNKKVNKIDDLVNKRWSKASSKATEFRTFQGNTFFGFGRNGKAKSDLYSDIIANTLTVNLFVESWRRGAGEVKSSDCQVKHQVSNINKLKLKTESYNLQQQWSFLDDHSKWAVSEGADAALTCIGDVNRMNSQLNRGGGAVCTKNLNLWKAFSQLVDDVELCAKNSSSKYFKSTVLFLFAILLSVSASL